MIQKGNFYNNPKLIIHQYAWGSRISEYGRQTLICEKERRAQKGQKGVARPPRATMWLRTLKKAVKKNRKGINRLSSRAPERGNWVFSWLSFANLSTEWGPGAIIRDGHRSIGIVPMIWANFSIFRTNCAIACGTRAYMLRGFSRMSRGKNGVRNSRNRFMLFSFGPQLNAFMAVGILLKYFRRKLLQFGWRQCRI